MKYENLYNGQTAAERGSGPRTISRVALRKQRSTITWYLAWAILALGWLGTVVVGNGGWGPFLTFKWTWTGWIGGLTLQLILTYVQWAWSDTTWAAWPARAIDAGLTALGYGILFLPALVGVLNIPYATPIAWAILWAFSLLPAWYPEHRLVK